MMRIEVIRNWNYDTETIGELYVFEGDEVVMRLWTLELPWMDNRRNVSCIPCGTYDLEAYSSDAHPMSFHILNVPNRDNILIHIGNYYSDTKGCIVLGMSALDCNGDGIKDVVDSRKAMKMLNKLIRKETSNGRTIKITIL